MSTKNAMHCHPDDPIRILLLHAWGHVNPGDEALAIGTIHTLRACFPAAKITVVSIYSRKAREFDESRRLLLAHCPDITVLPDDLRPVRPRGSFPAIRYLRNVLFCAGLVWVRLLTRVCKGSSVFAALRESDIIIRNGGHHFFWSDRMGQKRRILRMYTLPLVIARRLKKRYGLHAQSFGPFEFSRTGWPAKHLFRYVLGGAEFISVRETASVAPLKTCLADTKPVRHVLDPAFFLHTRTDGNAAEILARHSLRHKGFVACTFRLSRRGSQVNLPPQEYEDYADRLAEFLSLWTEKQDTPLALVCQVPKDLEDTESVLARMSRSRRRNCHLLADAYSPELLVELYAHALCVIGMRFHSLIFALVAGTPVMGLYYYDIGPKIRGLMNDIARPEYLHSLDSTSGSQIYDSASHLVAHAQTLAEEVTCRVERMKRASLSVLRDQIAGNGQVC